MKPALATDRLTAGYRAGSRVTEVIRDVSATLHAGEFACLVGINGAGKSTLLRTLAGLQPTLAGSVSFGDRPAVGLTRTERARTMSLVLTERTFARHLTGLDVVRLGRHPHTRWDGRLSDEDHRVVDDAITSTGCDDFVARPMTSMSDGERQRVLIARAVAQSPDVMLLDEPTAFLDVAHRLRLTALLRSLTHEAGIAVLMSTHDLELTLRTADTVWLVRQSGRVVRAAPEDIALSGVLTEEFPDERLAFEHEAGGFRVVPDTTRGAMSVEGDDDVALLWTTRALRRLGFAVTTDGAAPDVRVRTGRWELADGRIVHSVAELIEQLTSAGARPEMATAVPIADHDEAPAPRVSSAHQPPGRSS